MSRPRLLLLALCTLASGLALAQAVAISDDHISWRTVGMALLGVVCAGLSAAWAYLQGRVAGTAKDVADLRLEVARELVTGHELREAMQSAVAPITARLDTLEQLLLAQSRERMQESGNRRTRHGG